MAVAGDHRELQVEGDLDRCEGTGFCARVLPQVFEIGPEGKLRLKTDRVPMEWERQLLEAETLCPTQAITIRRANG